jgi:hypothetical protein
VDDGISDSDIAVDDDGISDSDISVDGDDDDEIAILVFSQRSVVSAYSVDWLLAAVEVADDSKALV